MEFRWSEVLLVVLLVLAPVRLQAQGMTLEQAISEAIASSHVIEASSSGVEAAQAAVQSMRAEHLPSLGLLGSYSQYDGDIFYNRFLGPPGSPPPPGVPAEPFDSTVTGVLQLSQTLYAGGAIAAGITAREKRAEVAAVELAARRRQLGYDVTKAFYDVLLAERAVEVAENSIERAERNLDEVTRRLAEDEALRVDLLGAESQLARDRHQLVQSSNQLELARRVFNQRLARELDTPVELAGDLVRAVSPVDANAVGARALANSEDIKVAEGRVEAADAMLRGAQSHFRPKLELQAFYSYLENEMFFEGSYYGGALRLSIPFFKDARAGRGAVGEARAQRALEQSLLEEVRSGVAVQVERAFQGLAEAESAVELATKALEYHRERYRVAEIAFREQVVTFSDLLDEHADLREAELNVSSAYYQARLAEAEVARLTGAAAD